MLYSRLFWPFIPAYSPDERFNEMDIYPVSLNLLQQYKTTMETLPDADIQAFILM